jgi:CheY-like chemotaxis protein/cytidylate kinase
MSIILIFSGSHCHGEDVAEAVSKELNYPRIEAELLQTVAERYGVRKESLVKTMYGGQPFFNRLTHEREKNLAYIRAGAAELIQRDDVLYHGFAGHFVPRGVTHALQICLIANFDYRVKLAAQRDNLDHGKAVKTVRAEDLKRFSWARDLHGEDPYSPGLYDLLLPMHTTSVAEAKKQICEYATRDDLKPTAASRQAAADFLLASQVNVALVEKGEDVDVTASNGKIHLGVNKYVMMRDRYEKKIEAIAKSVAGVKEVDSGTGTRYVAPGLLPPLEVDPPMKVLMVDDEREYVEALSTRLRTRKLPSQVVYDGEQALAVLENEPPEVMVLDLKMPGIDGIEVLRQVKRDYPQVEVIILTGHGSDRERKLAEELGAFAYLQKPVDIDVLARTMREAYRKIGKTPPPE